MERRAGTPRRAGEAEAPAATPTREIAIHLGQKSFQDDGFDPVEDQALVGLDISFEPREDSPFWIDTGLFYSWDDANASFMGGDADLDTWTLEFSVGVRKDFVIEALNLRPYVGVGGSLLYSSYENVSGTTFVDDEEIAFGGYGKVGLMYRVTPETFLGIEYRALLGSDFDFAGGNVDSDYQQVTAVFSAFF